MRNRPYIPIVIRLVMSLFFLWQLVTPTDSTSDAITALLVAQAVAFLALVVSVASAVGLWLRQPWVVWLVIVSDIPVIWYLIPALPLLALFFIVDAVLLLGMVLVRRSAYLYSALALVVMLTIQVGAPAVQRYREYRQGSLIAAYVNSHWILIPRDWTIGGAHEVYGYEWYWNRCIIGRMTFRPRLKYSVGSRSWDGSWFAWKDDHKAWIWFLPRKSGNKWRFEKANPFIGEWPTWTYSGPAVNHKVSAPAEALRMLKHISVKATDLRYAGVRNLLDDGREVPHHVFSSMKAGGDYYVPFRGGGVSFYAQRRMNVGGS